MSLEDENSPAKMVLKCKNNLTLYSISLFNEDLFVNLYNEGINFVELFN